ncbi:MAG: 16S rRNA (uracil(1498)-N(3))-methyltransferase [Prevotellaceae bacterium]|nr:16S rRNA (uracil(1498)-N(3))-methyltransferase [Prevotellaceae bacterium]
MFYTEITDGEICILSPEESRHCINVLRHGKNDTVSVFNRSGKVYTAKISDASPQKCVLEITGERNVPKRYGFLHVAIAPVKNIDRFEWFVEKAVEIGVEEITPLLCKHSERRVLKFERLEKIVISAMKQSLNLNFPKINPLTRFDDFIQINFDGQKFIAHCEEKTVNFADAISSQKSIQILIGPEGDFSKQEIENAISHRYIPVSLGNSRLRTETAGMVSCAVAAQSFYKQEIIT